MVDLPVYVGDAGAQEMWLLGSVLGKDRRDVHDWNILFRQNLLENDDA